MQYNTGDVVHFDGKPTWFFIYEFTLVTGLAYDQIPLALREEAKQVCIRDTYFKINAIRPPNLVSKIQKWPRGNPKRTS